MIDWFVVACPKDVSVYEDAIETGDHAGAIALRELSQLVLESCDAHADARARCPSDRSPAPVVRRRESVSSRRTADAGVYGGIRATAPEAHENVPEQLVGEVVGPHPIRTHWVMPRCLVEIWRAR